jgi:hypothetical protein
MGHGSGQAQGVKPGVDAASPSGPRSSATRR